ncbi:tape measure protein [Salmonella enterica subsp. enterica]|nr:tape measure protein [Salmonella enterica subsp. enterica]
MLSARLQAGSNATAAQRREIGELAGKLYDLKSAQDQASRSSSGLKTGLTAIASAITISQLVRYGKQFLEVADAMTQLQARIDRLSPSAEEGRKTFSALAEMASVSGTSLADTEKLWETLTSSLQSAGASNSQVLQLTDTLQKIGKIGGSSTQEMANALRQFGQSIASGTVRAQEFNSIVEQMPELARQIAAGMGISMDELRKLMLDGKLSAEDSLNAIMKQAGKVNDQFTKLPRSVEQATNTLSISFQTLVSEINDTTDASTTMVSVIDSITTAIEKLSGKVPTATQQIADLRSEAEMYARRARTWSWLGFGDWQKENEGRSAKLTAEAWEKSSRAGWDAAQNVAKNSKPIKIKTTTESTEKNGSNKAKNKSSADAAAEAISRQKAALDRLNTGYAEGSLELAQYDAVVALGNKATTEQIAKAKQQAKAIWQVTTAIKNRAQAEQAKRFTDQEIAANKTIPDAFTGEAQDPVAQIKLQEQQKLAALEKYQQIGVLSAQQYEDAKTAIQEQAANERINIARTEAQRQVDVVNTMLNGISQGFDGLATIIANSKGKNNTAYKALFAISKGFATAQAALNLQLAISNAMASGPFPWNMAAMAQVAAAGGSLISSIASVGYSGGRRYGGTVSAGNAYRVNEDGRSEIFQTAGGQQMFIPNQSGKVISADKVGGGGGVVQHITFEINTTGGIDDATKAWIVKSMKQVALYQINDQANRPNGMIQPRNKR